MPDDGPHITATPLTPGRLKSSLAAAGSAGIARISAKLDTAGALSRRIGTNGHNPESSSRSAAVSQCCGLWRWARHAEDRGFRLDLRWVRLVRADSSGYILSGLAGQLVLWVCVGSRPRR